MDSLGLHNLHVISLYNIFMRESTIPYFFSLLEKKKIHAEGFMYTSGLWGKPNIHEHFLRGNYFFAIHFEIVSLYAT